MKADIFEPIASNEFVKADIFEAIENVYKLQANANQPIKGV